MTCAPHLFVFTYPFLESPLDVWAAEALKQGANSGLGVLPDIATK